MQFCTKQVVNKYLPLQCKRLSWLEWSRASYWRLVLSKWTKLHLHSPFNACRNAIFFPPPKGTVTAAGPTSLDQQQKGGPLSSIHCHSPVYGDEQGHLLQARFSQVLIGAKIACTSAQNSLCRWLAFAVVGSQRTGHQSGWSDTTKLLPSFRPRVHWELIFVLTHQLGAKWFLKGGSEQNEWAQHKYFGLVCVAICRWYAPRSVVSL